MAHYLGTVVDLFSGAGGMSYGFYAHPEFDVVGAADVEVGKPSTGHGAIDCNATYEENIKVRPLAVDLGEIDVDELAEKLGVDKVGNPRVLIACPPCTGFSRAVARNWIEDDPRNSLVSRVTDFAGRLHPDIILMENVPQLLKGRFNHHFSALNYGLTRLGYEVHAASHLLSRFGLPQRRTRALVIAVRKGFRVRTLSDLWQGFSVAPAAVTVRQAIAHLPPMEAGATHSDDPAHTSTQLIGESLERLRAMPRDGGAWPDLLGVPESERFLIPSMRRAVEKGRLNAYHDVYGRMFWDRPAPTIKRECSHVGNGRYSHPSQDRLCTVRELATLQGFPEDYRFRGSRKNMYRQIGDAVPPLISYQLAWVAHWILTGVKPEIDQAILEGTSLSVAGIMKDDTQLTLRGT